MKLFHRYGIASLAFSLLLFSLLLLPAWRGEEQFNRTETLIGVTSNRQEGYHFNPYNPTYSSTVHGDSVCWESLYYVNPDNGTEYGWLCTHYEYSNNYKTIKWFIRPGVEWSDGQAFTAQDMIYTLNMIQYDPAVPMQILVADMINATAENDDLTCVINYAEPKPLIWTVFANLFYYGWRVVPEHIYSQNVNTGQPEGENLPLPSQWAPSEPGAWVATGPFVLYSAQVEGPFIYQRNDDYWGKDLIGLPKMKWIFRKLLTLGEQNIADVTHNELDLTGTMITWTQFLSAQDDNPHLQWIEHLDARPRVLYLNLDKYPLNYSSVRWALAHSINQTKLTEYTLEGHGYETSAIIADYPALKKFLPDTVGEGKTYDCTAYDPDEMGRVLTEIGCTQGSDGYWYSPNGTRISFEVYGWTWDRSFCEMTADMIRETGIDVSFKVPSFAECMNGILAGEQDVNVAWIFGWVNPIEPITWMKSHLYSDHGEALISRGELTAQAENVARWRNDTFDDLVEETEKLTIDDPQFVENCQKLYEIFYQELPMIPLNQPMNYFIVNNYFWTNWPTSGGDIVEGKLVDSDPSLLYGFPGAYWSDNGHLYIFYLQPTGRDVPSTFPWHYVGVVGVLVAAVGGGVWMLRRRRVSRVLNT